MVDQCPLLGVKRTSFGPVAMSAYDPKRTLNQKPSRYLDTGQTCDLAFSPASSARRYHPGIKQHFIDMATGFLGVTTITPVWRLRYDPLNFVGRCCSHIGKHQSTKRGSLRGPLVRGDLEERWRCALGLHVSLDRRMPTQCDRRQWQTRSPSPYYVANRTELKNSRQAARTGSKTIAKSEKSIAVKKKSEKSIAVKKESPRHRNANAHTKIAESTITTKIETPQHSQSDGKSNAELRNSIATKIETPQPSQPDGKSNAESKNSIATKIETPQPSQSDDKSNAEANMKSIAAKTETSQSSQFDDESVIKKARVTIAAKMDNPASVVFLDMKRAAREDALGNSIDTICGRVRGKLAGDTGDRPFLYVVQKDEAYIGAYTIATTEYRKICN